MPTHGQFQYRWHWALILVLHYVGLAQSDFQQSKMPTVHLVQNSVKPDALMHKSNSVPACCKLSSNMKYYNAGISFDSMNDDSQSQNVSVDFTATDSTLVCNDATSATVITQSVDEIQVLPTTLSSSVYMS